MPEHVFISIVVPTYNRAHLIADTLKSLQKQNYDQYEIIVVDDGSTDNTEEVVKALADSRTQYVKKNNAERAAARNFGASMAKGEYVNFFDSDDLALPNHLAEAAAMIQKHNHPEWFHLAFAWADTDGKVFLEINKNTGDTLNQKMSEGNQLSCNGVFVKRSVLSQYKFNEDRELSASEDYELWCRLAARFPLYYSNTITTWIIDHDARSVHKINGEKLIKRLKLLIQYLKQDEKVLSYFGSKFKKVELDADTYIALHLANNPPYKIKSIQYLFSALLKDASVVSKKRFYATIKNILIKW